MWHCLADNLFEEVEPVAVLKARKNENGTRDFLVKWSDGTEDSWVRTGILFKSPLCPVAMSKRPVTAQINPLQRHAFICEVTYMTE